MAPKRAGVQVDHTSPEIEFVHEALGDTSVTVRQSLGPVSYTHLTLPTKA